MKSMIYKKVITETILNEFKILSLIPYILYLLGTELILNCSRWGLARLKCEKNMTQTTASKICGASYPELSILPDNLSLELVA